jgi:hypothetical protein
MSDKGCPFDNPYCENYYKNEVGPDSGPCVDCEDAREQDNEVARLRAALELEHAALVTWQEMMREPVWFKIAFKQGASALGVPA